MKEIRLEGSDKVAIVSAADYPELMKYVWRERNGYSISYHGGKTIHMHRLINDTPKGMQTDHINGNRLDNRRSNLRSATHGQNQCNLKIRTNNRTGYRGVARELDPRYRNRGILYRVRVHFRKKDYWVGHFTDIKEAARAYNTKAKQLHGDFARLNEGV